MLPILFERALVAYLISLFPGNAFLCGHSNEDQTILPRVIVTATAAAGQLLQNAGVEELTIEIQCLTSAGTVIPDPDPILTVGTLADQIRGTLTLGNLASLEAAIEANPRLGFSGMEYNGHKEGRDQERSLHGVLLTYTVWAALIS